MRSQLILTTVLSLLVSNGFADQRLEEALKPYFDLDRNGLDERERQELMEHVKALQSRSVQTVEFKRQELPQDNNQWRYGMLLRDAYAAGVFLDSKEKISDAGAAISYTSNFETNADTLAATGALMFGAVGELNRNLDVDAEFWRATRLGFLGGVEFDTKWKNGDQSGSIAARFGAELETAQGGIFPYQYWKIDGVYTTDFDGEASLFGIETKWMPIADTLPIGKTWSLDGGRSAWVHFRPTLGLDYSYVSKNGEFTWLVPGEDYLWAGLKADIGFFFTNGPLERFSLKGKYIYMPDLLHFDDNSVHFGQVALSYALNDSGTTFLQARYTHGTTPRTLQEEDQIFVGLTALLGHWGVSQ